MAATTVASSTNPEIHMMRKWMVLAALVGAVLGITTAQAGVIRYTADLTGLAENPDVITPATGWAEVLYDDVAHTMRVRAEFSGLLDITTAAHIHCCQANPLANAGVATTTPSFVGFPLGVTAGTFDALYDMTLAASWNAAFITSSGGSLALAETRLFAAMGRGETYFNIHTRGPAQGGVGFPGGEIRGTLIPEPSALALSVAALLAIGAISRRRATPAPLTP